MPKPMTNFNVASQTLSALANQPARVRDNLSVQVSAVSSSGAAVANTGIVGQVDALDTYLTADSVTHKLIQEPLGIGRFNELTFRTNVVHAARELAASGASFSDSSKNDKVNLKFWTQGYGGKIAVRKFLKEGGLGSPAAAIRDICSKENGHLYGFECATAMMVIFHKAILDTVGDEAFDAMFTDPGYLKIFRWSKKDDDYLAVEKHEEGVNRLIPGSHYYYNNPDASDENSAFGGENVIYLGEVGGEKQFYGHGVIGDQGTYIVSEKDLLKSLSSLRKTGATTEPYRENFTYSLDANMLIERAKTYLS